MRHPISFIVVPLFILLGFHNVYSQGNLYTARGYWEETTKSNYLGLKQKLVKGDSLTDNEKTYIQDYETFLRNYFQKMSQAERDEFVRLKEQWDREISNTTATPQPSALQNSPDEFEWRTRDRLSSALYGIWYGSSLVVVAN